MTGDDRRVCESRMLRDGGRGVRFAYSDQGVAQPAFAIRYRGRVHAYVNACAHRNVELDWAEGEFFDADARYLICATHGARYDPASGRCLSGPCAGRALRPIPVHEQDGVVYAGAGPNND